MGSFVSFWGVARWLLHQDSASLGGVSSNVWCLGVELGTGSRKLHSHEEDSVGVAKRSCRRHGMVFCNGGGERLERGTMEVGREG